MGEKPEFPAFVHYVSNSKWQRTLIPIQQEADFHEPGHEPECGGPAEWLAEDCKIIDGNRCVFTVSLGTDPYESDPNKYVRTDEVISDAQLREMMVRNIRSLRKNPEEYAASSEKLSGRELFDFTFAYAMRMPQMSAAMQVGGCLLILLLVFLAAAIPIGVILWLFNLI